MAVKKTLFNVYAVVNSQPIAKINKVRLGKEAAEKKVAQLIVAGAARVYAVASRV
jgi:hypothetical protein